MPDDRSDYVQSSVLLRGGSVVTPGGILDADVLIQGEKIAALSTSESTTSAEEVVDVSGLTILPGGVDTHSHLREPGYGEKEDITAGTRAAAAGGYTTVVGMPNVQPPTTTVADYKAALELYASKAIVDFNHNPTATNLREVQGLADAGALGFKVFMITDRGTDYPHMPGLGTHDHGRLLEIAEAVAKTGLPLMVHPHDQALADLINQRFWDRGQVDFRGWARARVLPYDGLIWNSATALMLQIQRATGVHLHVLHINNRGAIDLIREAKRRGQRVTAEMNPQAVTLYNDWRRIEQLGPYACGYWVGDDATDHLWSALIDGTIDVLGTDHAPHTKAEKEIGWTDGWQSPSGVPALQETLSLFLTEVNAGRITIERFVELFSSGPAKIFGLYPRKGAIQVRSYADLAAVDLSMKDTIRTQDMHTKCGWTSYDGRVVQGVPIHTLVRGRFVMRDRKVIGRAGDGKLATHTAKPAAHLVPWNISSDVWTSGVKPRARNGAPRPGN